MRTFIFLCFTTIFAFTPNDLVSQNSKIKIKEEKTLSVDQVFDLIMEQTNFRFFYEEGIFNEYPKLHLKKGTIRTNELLKRSLSNGNLEIIVNDNNAIVIKEKPIPSLDQEQKHEVSGTVYDENDEPLPGANIIEKGTQNGTQSNFDGRFTLSVSNSNAVLVVSYLGYKSQEISVDNQTELAIVLLEDTAALDEIVVVGYGSQQAKKVSGSIAKAAMGELQDFPVSNFDQALAGKLAGVQVLQTTGEPGRELTIKVRGTGTITAGAEPLYVVDGVPVESPGQATEVINMEDIESIQVLKDAASASIYGSRGGNGVVIITTKKGKLGKMKVNFNHSIGFQEVSKKIDMMNAYEYAQLSKEGHDAAYLQEVPTGSANDPNSIRPLGYHKIPEELFPYLNGETGLIDTDWQDEIYRSATVQRYNISVSGASDNINYFISANHSDQEGIIINSDYSKTGLRANLGINSGKFKIGINLSPSYTFENRVSANNPYFDDGIVHTALSYSPTWPVYNPDGSYNYQGNGYWRIGTDYQHNEMVNPVALALLPTNEIEHLNVLSNLFIAYELLEGLKIKSSFALNYNEYQNEFYRPSSLETRGRGNSGRLSNSEGRLSTTNIYKWTFENTINYTKRFGDHNLELLGGMTAEKSRTKLQRTSALIGPETRVENAIQVINSASPESVTSTASLGEWSLYSLLARVQYDFAGKYLLSASMRADASSRFGANNKWGYFPSVSGGWRISQESFMKNINWLNEFKIRGSYGATGNFQIGNYQQAALLGTDEYVTGIPGQLQTGFRPSQVPNPDLSWEQTYMFNIGLDAELFERQLRFTVEYYNGDTEDLLLEIPVPQTTGFGSALQNIGKVNNSGFEAIVNISPKLGDFKWDSSFNISVNRNEVKELGPEGTPIITTAGTGHAFFKTEIGQPIGNYFVLVQDGIFSTQEQLDQYPHFGNTAVGDFRFVDINKDGVLDVNEDRTIVGNYAPDFTYGFSNAFKFKGFDLNVAFQGSYGGEVLNLMRRYNANSEGNFNNTREMLNRWQSEANPGDGNTNRANRKSRGNNGRTSTWHIEDGSYLRLQNVSLGYSLPGPIVEKLNISKARIYITGNNLYTWSDYTGYNPEVNLAGGSDQLTPGLDYGVYPLAKTYSLGINVSF
ncbi:SusC/RagA family TonB-linked outer membrane protein [Aestuariivivens sediminis]|uniref:SusC/RagA family TonB-linked outer membrane protein n=1 Tax=Aestuariivivens sediminis TaxID=2913557 RepID=UPI001F5815EC|nr:TonB-dependent receptor [Aestuariivivens sediminis]